MSESRLNARQPIDPETLADTTRLFIEHAHGIIAHMAGASGDVVVNALLSAAVNIAISSGGTTPHIQSSFRKVAEGVPAMVKAYAKMVAEFEDAGGEDQ